MKIEIRQRFPSRLWAIYVEDSLVQANSPSVDVAKQLARASYGASGKWRREIRDGGVPVYVDARKPKLVKGGKPFVVRCPGTELYWNKEDGWVSREKATVYTTTGPDLSIGERVDV